jgi:exopolysaccharide production protein ExoZ
VTAAGTTPQRRSSGHFDALDGVRGFAVLLVFCVHAAGNAAHAAFGANFGQARLATLTGPGEIALYWLYCSHHGVYLFFVLSGFLIGRMWWPRPVTTYAAFAWRRTLRIYPAFLLALAGSLVFAATSGIWRPSDLATLGANLLFLNGLPSLGVVALNTVTWSLFYEMTFYLAFPALALVAIALGPRAGVALWFCGVTLPFVAVGMGADYLVVCWSLLFCGVALAVHETALRGFAARVPAVVAIAPYLAVTTLAFAGALSPTGGVLAFGVAATLVVAKSLAPANAIEWFFTRGPLRALGRISYSFYLVHWMLVVLVARAAEAHAGAWHPIVTTLVIFGAGFAVSVAVATALWWVAERPYFAWARSRSDRRRTPPGAAREN